MAIKHVKTATIADDPKFCIGSGEWNDCHVITGDVSFACFSPICVATIAFNTCCNLITPSAAGLVFSGGNGIVLECTGPQIITLNKDANVSGSTETGRIQWETTRSFGCENHAVADITVDFLNNGFCGEGASMSFNVAGQPGGTPILILNNLGFNVNKGFQVTDTSSAAETTYIRLDKACGSAIMQITADAPCGGCVSRIRYTTSRSTMEGVVCGAEEGGQEWLATTGGAEDDNTNRYLSINMCGNHAVEAHKPLILASFTDANRGTPAAAGVGAIIFNSNDNGLNISDGTNWRAPSGGWVNT